ncbi:DUF4192 domain-containing protein [Pseudarthrobacter sp. AL07]|uniref:DUF4192 domain-containing protein n=1 Tax=unclassified Pseudarthrobacter TaxID=2647000 RepID=UPI00249C31B8|nr:MULTISPECIES: DUF4192 domain-containing protein [unclassified Pseudarthrobacter]MDI3194679.1 DUF4192 domain-containing protein [Pseudarthrobacter sp. AL20]MDI3208746.1 DUF4192 domain-containing protein [Pseudarthrobacter sp. AL07]
MKPSEHLTVRGPEDILGFIPHSLGYWPADSLVAMTLQGNRLGATLRLDLPGPETLADPRDYARTVRDYLRADGNADAALLACFTNDGWMEPPGTYRGLLDALQSELGAAGMPVRDAWYVGDAYWRDAYCTDPSCCPSPGRSVQAIRDSMLNAEMVFRGSSVGPAPEDGAHPPPTLSGADRTAILAYEETWAEQLDRRRGSRDQFGQLMVQWEALLANVPGQVLPVNEIGYLRASLRVPAWRDAVLVMAAAGQAAALAGAEKFDIFDAGCILAPVGPALLGFEPSGLASGAGAAGWGPAGQGIPGIPGYGEVLLGLDPVVPAWHTLNSLDAVLEQLSACGGQAGAAALTGRGWIAWCRGRGSYAAAYLGRALEEQPGYRLAELMLELVRRGTLCGWAARKEAAWRKFEPDAA